QQKKRRFAPERQEAKRATVDRGLKSGLMSHVQYPAWVSNVVLVKKKDQSYRMCVDFTDLNKATPKDCYPLPRIDQLVDATSGHELLSFLDAYSGYHQIRMHPNDRRHTAFITDTGLYCYNRMPFGLKNAGATYQRLVNQMFSSQLGRNMEVYVDDMLVKSTEASAHLADLEETFNTLRQYKLKLNPAKCAFGVQSGKFLGYLVTQRGIEANPEKIQAIINLERPRGKQDLQSLAGRVAALGCFMSRSAERCLPFFKALRRKNTSVGQAVDFEWTVECQASFDELKKYISSPPVLSKPVNGEVLYLYLSVTMASISS